MKMLIDHKQTDNVQKQPWKNTLNGIHKFPTDHCFNLLIIFRFANLIYHIIWQYTSIL